MTHRFTTVFLCAAALFTVLMQTPSAQTASTPIAITNVTVIDVESGMRLADHTVVMTGNRITAVGPSARTNAPAGARIVDGRGKFLVPGFWDVHVHSLEHLGVDYSYGMEPFKLYIANGITGVRDMGSSVGQVIAGKKRIADGRLVAPRIVAAGPLFEAGEEIAFNRALIAQFAPTPEAGRLGVNTNKDAGMDLVKAHSGLSRDTFLAMLDEAKRIGMTVAGHVPNDVTAVEASNAGLRSLEHMASIAATCRSGPAPGRGAPPPTGPIPIDDARCDEALRVIAKNGTFLSPTLVSSFPWTTTTAPDTTARRVYLKPQRRATCPAVPAEERPGARIGYEFNERIVARAAKAGVRLLLATDTTTCRQPGWATLDEIVLLGRAGVPAIDVLRAATINAATAVDMQAQVGTVTRGKLADLVLLDADPLADVANVNRISAVVADGRLFDEAGRKQLFADVLANAQGTGAATTSAQR